MTWLQRSQQLSSIWTRKSPRRSACQQAEAPQSSQMVMKGVVIAAGDVAAAETAAELNLDATESRLQCLPSGRGTTVVTNDHERRSHCRRRRCCSGKQQLSSIWKRKSPRSSACQQAEAPQSSHTIMKAAAIATGDVAAAETAAELNVDAKEPTSQCLPAGRGTAVVTNDHERRSHCRR